MRRRDLLTAAAGVAAVASVVPGLRALDGVSDTAVTRRARPGRPGTPVLAIEITHGPVDRPNVALTFHGQGPAAIVDPLLGILADKNVQVTVLAVGTWLANTPMMARKILDAGHELGNHTQHHLAIARLPVAEMRSEITACAAEISALTGTIGAWFRPSQTQHATPLIRAEAAAAGYPTCLSYDLDSLDYTDPGPAAITRTVFDNAHNGAIISMHFGHPGTVVALPGIIDGLRGAGFTPVTMTGLVRP